MNNNKETIDAVIVAAGSGTRLGYSLPKAFVPIEGKPMLSYSLDTFLSHAAIESVILVVPATLIETARDNFTHERITIVTGGDQRWQSVNNGVSSSTADWVLIHDAARPFVNHSVIDAILQKRQSYDCVITATPEVDTIRMFEGDRAGITVNRDQLVRVGTPQMFRRTMLCKGLEDAAKSSSNPTDEAILMQNMGIAVGIAWGDPKNFKITTPSDLEIAEAIVARNQTVQLGR